MARTPHTIAKAQRHLQAMHQIAALPDGVSPDSIVRRTKKEDRLAGKRIPDFKYAGTYASRSAKDD